MLHLFIFSWAMPPHFVDFTWWLSKIRYNLKYFEFYKMYLHNDLCCIWKESHINKNQPEFSDWLCMSEFPWGDRNESERASTHSNPSYMEHESLRPMFVYTWKDKILFQREKITTIKKLLVIKSTIWWVNSKWIRNIWIEFLLPNKWI